MPTTPTFDYLTVTHNTNGPALAKYIVTSKVGSINFTYNANRLESYSTLMDQLFEYLSDLFRNLPGQPGERAPTPKIYLLRIYADSITIRSNYKAPRVRLPLRSNVSYQLTKIPFVDISDSFVDDIQKFILDLDSAATEVAQNA